MVRRMRLAVHTLLVNALILSSLYHVLIYLANRRFWRQPSLPPPEDVPTISAIVPLHDRTLDTLAVLHRLATQRPTDQYEVILALESEDASAHTVAREAADAYPDVVRLVLAGPPGDHAPAMHLLHAGSEAARGALVAFIAPDVLVTAELWNAALAALTDPALDAVFAPPLALEPEHRESAAIPTGGETLVALYVNHARTAALPLAALTGRVRSMANGFVLIRRSALDAAGGLRPLLDQADPAAALGRHLRGAGIGIGVIPVPAMRSLDRQTSRAGTDALVQDLATVRAYNPAIFGAWPLTNPLTVGFLLGWITEAQGRWWGRRTWWGFAAFRLLIAYGLDRQRFGRAFTLTAYGQLFMLDTFISPALWLRALARRTIALYGRAYRLRQGGQVLPRAGSVPE